eukprot:2056715-Pleurochrysis_carterae.AAC.5
MLPISACPEKREQTAHNWRMCERVSKPSCGPKRQGHRTRKCAWQQEASSTCKGLGNADGQAKQTNRTDSEHIHMNNTNGSK